MGMIIGCLGTIGFQEMQERSKPSYAEARSIEKELGIKVKDLSTDDLYIFSLKDFQLQIISKKNPELAVVIDSILSDEGGDQGMMSAISLLDQSGIHADFNDRDSDGIWDDRSYSTTNMTYYYGRKSGYPDMILGDDNRHLVRIEDEYFDLKLMDGKHFIEQDRAFVELEYVNHCSFRIKEGEPVQ